MALIDKKILSPIRYHQDNANTVIGQASTMKALFDQGAEDLRVKINGVIDELLATTGAQQIGIDPARGLGNTLADALTNIKTYMNLGASGISASTIGTGSGNTVQSQLEWLLLQIQDVLLNQIPDGTITMQKLATALANTINGNTSNIGDLTALTTTEKTNLVGAVNEVNSQLAQRVNKAGDTMTGNLNVPSINSKIPAYAIAPTETVITTGFATGWSGAIKIKKNQEGLVTLYINASKNTAITLAGETIYNLPTQFRATDTSLFSFNASDSNFVYSKALVNLVVYNNGELFVIPASSQDMTNAVTIPRVVISYYAD